MNNRSSKRFLKVRKKCCFLKKTTNSERWKCGYMKSRNGHASLTHFMVRANNLLDPSQNILYLFLSHPKIVLTLDINSLRGAQSGRSRMILSNPPLVQLWPDRKISHKRSSHFWQNGKCSTFWASSRAHASFGKFLWYSLREKKGWTTPWTLVWMRFPKTKNVFLNTK